MIFSFLVIYLVAHVFRQFSFVEVADIYNCKEDPTKHTN